MKKLALLLALALTLVAVLPAVSGLAIDYPIDTNVQLTISKVLDGSIAEGGYTSSNDTPAFIAWEDATGIDVEIQEYADETALVLALNGGRLPDMFMMNPSSYNGGIMGMVNDDMIIQITPEMLEENAPDYWAYVNKPEYLDLLVELDGNMYRLSAHLFEPDSIYRFWRGIFYRGDILESIGYTEFPTDADGLYELLKALKDSGIPTPMVFQGKDDLREMLRNGDIDTPFGLVNAAEYQIDGVWHYGAYEPEYKDVLAYMHKLYEEGLISTDYLTMENSVAQSMICNGEAAIIYGNNSRLNTFANSLPEGAYFVPAAPLKGDQEHAYFSYADAIITTGDTTYISADSEYPELCMQFYNYLFTEQGNLLRNFGTEGKSYELDEQGVPHYTEFITNNPDGHALDGMARSWALINWPGIHADVMNAQRHPADTQIVAYELWSNTDHDKYAVTHPQVVDEYLNDYTNLWVDIDQYINECRAKFISGEMSVEDDFDSYIQHLKDMGMDKVVEYKQATLDAYNAR